jgi:sugar phosphate isomerase/epimerase
MQKCFSTLGCGELDLDAVLTLAKAHGVPLVELRALGGGIDPTACFSRQFAGPEALAAAVRAGGVRVTALDTSLKLAGSADGEWEQALAAFLPWAEALGGVDLRVFDGGGAADPAAAREEMAARLAWWAERRAARGWRSDVMIETHDSLFTAEAILALADAAPAARILWDAHHTWKRGGEDPAATWAAIAPRVVHVHVKDSVSRPSARHPFTYVLPGDGEFPAAALTARLRDGFAGPVSLEWERWWHPYLPPLAEALETANRRAWW